VDDGDEQNAVWFDPIPDAVIGVEEFSQCGVLGFGNDPTDLREAGQVLDCADDVVKFLPLRSLRPLQLAPDSAGLDMSGNSAMFSEL
jgi:hypothetical protein